MKNLIYISFMFVAISGSGQGNPYYDHEVTVWCEDLGGGATRQLDNVKLFRVGRDSAVFQFYTDSLGNKVIPSGTLTEGSCNNSITVNESALPVSVTPYQGHLHTFTEDTNVGSTPINIPFSGSFREVVVYNYTQAVIRVNFEVTGIVPDQTIFVPPFGTYNFPNPKSRNWNHGKIRGIYIVGESGLDNVGSPTPAPMIIVDVKDYD